MSDIFISYAREDKVETEKLASVLEAQGWSVWWDRTIRYGKRFEREIEQALDQAKCVVVIWSDHSVNSDWVLDESAEAKRQGKLIPLNIDGSTPPLSYRGLQTGDFRNWSGETTATVFKQLENALRGHIRTSKSDIQFDNNPSSDVSRQSEGIEKQKVEKQESRVSKTKLNQHSFQEPELVRITGGKFLMGSPETEEGRNDDEQQHEVCVDDFAIGQYPVTFAEYDLFCEETGQKEPDDKKWGRDNRPVINVSWKDAYDYAQWLAEVTGQPYRLLTEAEWEHAARGGSTTAYWWGDTFEQDRINCNVKHGKTTPVNTFKPNPLGLYDMSGNVLEWTGSLYQEDYGDSENKCADRDDSGQRVVRGGSWDGDPRYARSATRARDYPDDGYGNIGCRLAQD